MSNLLPKENYNIDLLPFECSLEAAPYLRNISCSANHWDLNIIPKVRISSTKNKCVMFTYLDICKPWNGPRDYASLIFKLRPSMTRIKIKGEREHPSPSSRPTQKKVEGRPLISTTKHTEVVQAMIHSTLWDRRPTL